MRPSRSAWGFTLVELLVVISIIALLISMLLPALGNARQAARNIGCLNHVRQLGMAFISYHAQNRDTYPAWVYTNPDSSGVARTNLRWTHLMGDLMGIKIKPDTSAEYSYGYVPVRSVFVCPAWPLKSVTADQKIIESVGVCYGYNYQRLGLKNYLDASSSLAPVRIGHLKKPSRQLVLTDARGSDGDPTNGWLLVQYGSHIALRHGKEQSGNVSFADGHAATTHRNLLYPPTATSNYLIFDYYPWNCYQSEKER